MANKSIMEEALLAAEEIESAALENAKCVVMEAFTPRIQDFMKSALAEEDEVELDDDEEITEADDSCSDDDEEITEAEDSEDDDEEITEAEDEEDDEDEITEDEDSDDDDEEITEDEDSDDEEDDEELEIDDEMFDDSEVEDDEDIDIDIEDDEDIDIEDDEIELDIEDDEEDEITGDDLEEGLYARRNGEFVKVTPTQYLENKIEDLEEEKGKLANAVTYLRDQLQEVNLFNTKLTYANKLYESGMFNAEEKLIVAERLDECNNIKQIKREYKSITRQLDNSNPLDQINEMIKTKSKRVISENVYESDEMNRMKKLAGI
jgi:hypothetical protein